MKSTHVLFVTCQVQCCASLCLLICSCERKSVSSVLPRVQLAVTTWEGSVVENFAFVQHRQDAWLILASPPMLDIDVQDQLSRWRGNVIQRSQLA